MSAWESSKGKVYPVYFVMCAICEHEMPITGVSGSRDSAISKLKEWGWKRTRKYGYVCKDCATKPAEE